MPNKPHQTTPFRRPSSAWVTEAMHDPADMGTEYGLEMRLEGFAPASASGDERTKPSIGDPGPQS